MLKNNGEIGDIQQYRCSSLRSAPANERSRPDDKIILQGALTPSAFQAKYGCCSRLGCRRCRGQGIEFS